MVSARQAAQGLLSAGGGGEDAAFETFCKLRWPETNGAPVCPKCGSLDAYKITTRRKFKCRDKSCHHQFSPTSGTIFASRKMAYVDLLAAIFTLMNGAKGMSALQLARNIDCQHKTAFVLKHKVREALAAESQGVTLTGTVEVDGAYFGGHIRPANLAEDRIDRRLAQHQTVTWPDCMCLFPLTAYRCRRTMCRLVSTGMHHEIDCCCITSRFWRLARLCSGIVSRVLLHLVQGK